MTTNTRTLRPITTEAFDAAFGPVPAPVQTADGRGTSETATYIGLEGEVYSLTRVVMPDGELRRAARQFNGYCDEVRDLVPVESSMRYDCAWSVVDVLPPAPAEAPVAPADGTLTEHGTVRNSEGALRAARRVTTTFNGRTTVRVYANVPTRGAWVERRVTSPRIAASFRTTEQTIADRQATEAPAPAVETTDEPTPPAVAPRQVYADQKMPGRTLRVESVDGDTAHVRQITWATATLHAARRAGRKLGDTLGSGCMPVARLGDPAEYQLVTEACDGYECGAPIIRDPAPGRKISNPDGTPHTCASAPRWVRLAVADLLAKTGE